MKSTYYQDVDFLADKIIRKVDELGEDHPDINAHLVRLILDFFKRNQKDYEILDDDDPRVEEPFPDLVSASIRPWW